MNKNQKTKLEELAKGEDIMAVVAQDTIDSGEDNLTYLEDIVNNSGCSGGSCRGLIYYKDTHAFYQKYASECDDVLYEYERGTGEAHKFGGNDVQNTLAWMAYEERCRSLLDLLEELN